MAFDHSDLKRLKECTPLLKSGGDVYIQLPFQVYGLSRFEQFNLTALLARLEAAERCASYLGSVGNDDDDGRYFVEAWRKACGE